MHYMHGSPRDKDYKEDMKLPFKTADNYSATVSPALFPQLLPALAFPSLFSAEIKLPVFDQWFNQAAYLSGIWQPPRSC